MNFMHLPKTFSIFPVHDKKPLVDWKVYQARLPQSIETDTWKKQFLNAQWGIACGPVSKILVLDDDGGLDLVKYPVPKTLTQSTPRGGRHYFFRWTPELENKVTTKVGVLDRVDIRGDGGYVVFYGFNVPYSFCPIAYPPKWLIDLLPNKYNNTATVVQNNHSQIEEILNDIHIGNRNDSFTRLAGSLRARGYSGIDIYGILISKAREVGFGDRELKTICESVSRYQPNIKIDETDDSLDTFFKDVKPREWIIPNLLGKESVTFLAGLPKCAKSWLLIDLAIEAARKDLKGQWLGKFPITHCNVMYIDQERSKDECQRRFLALMKEKGLAKSDLQLRIKSKTHIKLDLDHSFEAFKKELRDKKPNLVLVDSFITFHNKNVMDQVSVMPVLEKIKELRNEFKCSFVFIYHDRKSTLNPDDQKEPSFEDMVGSVFISSVADHCFSIRKQEADSSMIYHTANNFGILESPFLIKVIDVDKDKIKVEAY